MQNRYSGTLIRHRGKLTIDAVMLHENAVVVNNGIVHTWTTVSSGTISGTGTWWARYDTSKPIGGEIASTQIIIYWPFDRQFVLPVVFGGLICIPKTQGEGGLT